MCCLLSMDLPPLCSTFSASSGAKRQMLPAFILAASKHGGQYPPDAYNKVLRLHQQHISLDAPFSAALLSLAST